MSFGDRLQGFRKARGISQTEMAEVMGCRQPTVCDYEKNNVSPSVKIIQKIAETYKVNLNWLMTGKGEMMLSESDIMASELNNFKVVFETKIDSLVHAISENIVSNVSECDKAWYFKIEGDIVCGEQMPIRDESDDLLIPIAKRKLASQKGCKLYQVNGESMSPEIEHGDVVLIKSIKDWKVCRNKVVMIETLDGVTLFRYLYDEKSDSAFFMSTNKQYNPITPNKTHKLLGVVIQVIRFTSL